MKFKTASFTRLLVPKTNLDPGAGLDTKWHVTVSLYNFSHMRAHTHICRPTHTVPALQTHTHKHITTLCVSQSPNTFWVTAELHTYRGTKYSHATGGGGTALQAKLLH